MLFHEGKGRVGWMVGMEHVAGTILIVLLSTSSAWHTRATLDRAEVEVWKFYEKHVTMLLQRQSRWNDVKRSRRKKRNRREGLLHSPFSRNKLVHGSLRLNFNRSYITDVASTVVPSFLLPFLPPTSPPHSFNVINVVFARDGPSVHPDRLQHRSVNSKIPIILV